jgi:hypothetical protein
MSDAAIAEKLDISRGKASNYVHSIIEKLGCTSRYKVQAQALREGYGLRKAASPSNVSRSAALGELDPATLQALSQLLRR